MKVFTCVERLDKPIVFAQMSHDAHFDLRIVRSQKSFKALAYLEGVSNLATALGFDRNVLQVWRLARKSAGRSTGLNIIRVDPAIGRDRFVQDLYHLANLGYFAVF